MAYGLAIFLIFSGASLVRVIGWRESLGVQPIWVPFREIDLGELRAGDEITVAVPVCNVSWRGLTVVGAKYACSCMAVDSLPVYIPPGTTRSVLVKYRAQASKVASPTSPSVRLLLSESENTVDVKFKAFVQNHNEDRARGKVSGEL